MRATFAVGRRPRTGNHSIPGNIALLPGMRSQTADADATQTGRSLIIFYQSCLNLKMYDFVHHPRCRTVRGSQNQSIVFPKKGHNFKLRKLLNLQPYVFPRDPFFHTNYTIIPKIMYYVLKVYLSDSTLL